MELRSGFSKHSRALPDLVQERHRALTVREVATVLHVSERLIYRMASEGVIPSFKVCGSVRFDPTTTAAWLRRSMICSPTLQSNQGNSRIFRRAERKGERRVRESAGA
jgi:excisionase family DNA binding protein